MKNIAILISGSGTNMESILRLKDECNFNIKCVISSKVGAEGLTKARKYNIDANTIDRKIYSTKDLFEKVLKMILDDYNVNFIVLAGYMLILSDDFVKMYPKRIFNIHPSLLPDNPGLNAVKKSLKSGKAGFTIHYVEPGEVDSGEIIFQKEVQIIDGDTTQSLHDRIKINENEWYPKVLDHVINSKPMSFL
tara:strand:+ start:215 stop:790 length:576 start_codon:yes stop_codon:yes gene_type:complete